MWKRLGNQWFARFKDVSVSVFNDEGWKIAFVKDGDEESYLLLLNFNSRIEAQLHAELCGKGAEWRTGWEA